MAYTYETMEEFLDPYSPTRRIAERNGYFETEKMAQMAALEAGYDFKNIVILFLFNYDYLAS